LIISCSSSNAFLFTPSPQINISNRLLAVFIFVQSALNFFNYCRSTRLVLFLFHSDENRHKSPTDSCRCLQVVDEYQNFF
jgi:hypothetical protein